MTNKLRIVTVLYPGEFSYTYTVESELPDEKLLEVIFANWNLGSGDECKEFTDRKVRSLSVNDIVTIDSQPYQCKSIGWEKVTDDFVDRLDGTVRDHPDFEFAGAFYALNDICWKAREGKIVI